MSEAEIPPIPKDVPEKDLDFTKIQYPQALQAWLNAATQRATAAAATKANEGTVIAVSKALNATREDIDRSNEADNLKTIHDAYIEVSKGSLDRATTRVNVVTAAVATVITLYTTLLGLVYAADTTKGKLFTPVAIIPAVFLGMALFLVTVYAALFKQTINVGPLLPTGIAGQVAEMRLITFMRWSFAGVLERAWALHAGIVSFGVGIATLPLPFISMKGIWQVIILVVGVGVVAITAGGTNHEVPLVSKLIRWLGKL